MKLDDFVDAEIIRLREFKRWWHEKHEKENPHHYPLNMNEGDWLDQYSLWEGSE